MNREFILKYFPVGSVGAEIGVWQGAFAKKIYETVKPRLFYLIDPWRFIETYPDRWYGGKLAQSQLDMDTIYHDVVKYFSTNNVKILRIYSNEMKKYINYDELDWVYIDGNHSYKYVLNDLMISYDLVKTGGIIAGDDYEIGNDIQLAVTDFIQTNGINVELTLQTDRQFILTKK